MEFYTCPVCGYNHLEDPPMDDEICPSCGTQFGYHDHKKTHQQLRLLWIKKRAPWHSKVDTKPVNWNPIRQLRVEGFLGQQEVVELQKAGLLRLQENSKTESAIDIVVFNNTSQRQMPNTYGQVVVNLKYASIGTSGKGIGCLVGA